MIVTTMKGVKLDMGKLLASNEAAQAVGNASMNARGDKLGAGGRVVKTAEQVSAEYNAAPKMAVKQTSLRDLSSENFVTPAEAAKAHHAEMVAMRSKKSGEAASVEAQADETSVEKPVTSRKRKLEDR